MRISDYTATLVESCISQRKMDESQTHHTCLRVFRTTPLLAESGLKHLPYQAKAANRAEQKVACFSGKPPHIVR
jgi:hypothetical protein